MSRILTPPADLAHAPLRHFASDNYAGICPEAWEALAQANRDHCQSYGEDKWTRRAAELVRQLFETDCQVFFVFNGTAANSLSLAAICRSYHSVFCHELAHVGTDECGAPEFFSNGAKVLLLPGAQAKIDVAALEAKIHLRGDIHYPKPCALSVTQATELGAVYLREEIRALAEVAKKNGLKVHMDGARFANAAASLGAPPKEITWNAGVDVLCFGGTKNGALIGEAIVFFDRGLAQEFDYRRKQAGQLASKMRFLAACWVGLLENGAWLRHAAHANAMAERLLQGIKTAPGVGILFPRQANSVFADIPVPVQQKLRDKGWLFYTFVGATGCRLMCAWDTRPEDVDRFANDLARIAAG